MCAGRLADNVRNRGTDRCVVNPEMLGRPPRTLVRAVALTSSITAHVALVLVARAAPLPPKPVEERTFVVEALKDTETFEAPKPAPPPPPPPRAPEADKTIHENVVEKPRDVAHHVAAPPMDAPPAAPVEASAAIVSDQPASFAMSIGNGSSLPFGAVRTEAPPSTGKAGGLAAVGDETFSELSVSTPARLVRGGPPSYPEHARADGVEGSVGLEIIVSTGGAVESVRVQRSVGHGLDEAAIAAVRGYRFSPAMKDSRPVRVRMRWNVQFHLD